MLPSLCKAFISLLLGQEKNDAAIDVKVNESGVSDSSLARTCSKRRGVRLSVRSHSLEENHLLILFIFSSSFIERLNSFLAFPSNH
jgi:hypothetical protein